MLQGVLLLVSVGPRGFQVFRRKLVIGGRAARELLDLLGEQSGGRVGDLTVKEEKREYELRRNAVTLQEFMNRMYH